MAAHVIERIDSAVGSYAGKNGGADESKKNATSGGPRTSSHADAELQHIERAIGQLRAMSQKPAGTLNVDYWHERLPQSLRSTCWCPRNGVASMRCAKCSIPSRRLPAIPFRDAKEQPTGFGRKRRNHGAFAFARHARH